MGKSREPTSGDDKPPTGGVSLSVMTIGKNANNPLFYPVTGGCKTLFPASTALRTTAGAGEGPATRSSLLMRLMRLAGYVLPDARCARMRKWPRAHDLSGGRWRRHFFFRRGIYHRIARDFTKRDFPKRYPGATFIKINRRSSHRRALFQLNYDKIIRALDTFLAPDFAALQAPAIQRDGARVRFRLAPAYDLHYAANGKSPVYRVRNYIL